MNQKVQSPSQNWTFDLEVRSFADDLLDSDSASDSDDVLEVTLPTNSYSIRVKITAESTDNVKFFLPYVGLQRDNYLDINF